MSENLGFQRKVEKIHEILNPNMELYENGAPNPIAHSKYHGPKPFLRKTQIYVNKKRHEFVVKTNDIALAIVSSWALLPIGLVLGSSFHVLLVLLCTGP